MSSEFLSSIMARGLHNGGLANSLVGEPAVSWDDLLARAEKFILIEESRRIKSIHQKPGHRENLEKVLIKRRREEDYKRKPDYYNPLKVTRAEALVVAEKSGIIKWPPKMRENEERQKSRKYCSFHQDRGHETEECVHLRKELERLIELGQLPEELYHSVKASRKHDPVERGLAVSPPGNWSGNRVIHLIEGAGYGGNSRTS
ncbi:UNVERIFIED_CONTAM: hypothetical protein Sradi_3286000 [Sesamum radiatum]|uniref:Uncharacterized protein n=1 Tax=Sesamum radiatum TaxID=300843 RepID=A0AAW2R1N9_SESRA